MKKMLALVVAVVVVLGVFWANTPDYYCEVCGKPVSGSGYVALIGNEWYHTCEECATTNK